MENDTVLQVLTEYPLLRVDCEVHALGSAGGLSGAEFWRLQLPDQSLCLRRWPATHPDGRRLAYIHSVLEFAAQRGVGTLPVPHRTTSGATFVSHDDTLWELTSWLPGSADFDESPSDTRIRAAFRAAAQLHLALEHFPTASTGPAPGLVERSSSLTALRSGKLDEIISAAKFEGGHQIAQRIERFLPLFWMLSEEVQEALTIAAQQHVGLQPCVRDLRREHVLFVGDHVAGLVDFGATRNDYAGGDVARLLGSLLGDLRQKRALALDAYREVRPLTGDDLALIELYDRCNVLVSPTNWFRWIGLEKRRFDRPEQVLQLLDTWVSRLEVAAAR